MFKDLPEGQTHYENDDCGEPAHNKGFKPSDFEKSWEKQYDTMIAPLTESTADIKQFIHQLLDEERKRIAQEFADLDIILKKKPNIPMGVSQWRNYGIKYKYYDYFADQIIDRAVDECRKHSYMAKEELKKVIKAKLRN